MPLNEFGFETIDPPGEFTSWELEAIDRVLASRPRSAVLRQQLATARVTARCPHCPSIDLVVASDAPRLGPTIDMPTLHGKDLDGMFVEIVLIVRDDRVTALDVWRGDGAEFHDPPLDSFVPI